MEQHIPEGYRIIESFEVHQDGDLFASVGSDIWLPLPADQIGMSEDELYPDPEQAEEKDLFVTIRPVDGLD